MIFLQSPVYTKYPIYNIVGVVGLEVSRETMAGRTQVVQYSLGDDLDQTISGIHIIHTEKGKKKKCILHKFSKK